MPVTRVPAMIGIVLRCYPRPWRRRHGGEAAELAALLLQDGVPAWSIAWDYLHGAARERLTFRPGQRLAAAVTVLLAAAGSVGAPLALLSATAPASAASAHVSHRGHTAVRLRPRPECGAPLGETGPGAGPAGLPAQAGHDQRC
jgi:hypothetical protein